MAIPPVLSRLPEMPVKKRRELSVEAHRLAKENGARAADARQVIAGIAAFELEMFLDSRKLVGQIEWEPFKKQHIKRGFDHDHVVSTIEYENTHKTKRKEVFQVYVLGKKCGDLFHNVADARIFGSEFYEKLKVAKSGI